MKIIDRYIIRGFAGSFVWCTFVFVVMAIIIDIFSFIDDIVRYKIPATSLIAFYVYYAPTIIIQVVPMAVLLSAIYLLSTLNKNNEVTALRASGISLWRMLAPMLIMSLVISMGVFIINDRIIPVSSRVSSVIRRDELEKEKRKNQQARIVENVAIYGAGNRIVFARNYDTQMKTLGDIIIHQHDSSENLVSKITAQSGIWTGSEWKFYNVIGYRIDNAGNICGEPQFSKELVIPLQEKPRDFANREWKADFVSYRELTRYIKNFKGAGKKLIRGLLVELHYKVSFPFISFVIVLIGAPFALITTRGGVLIGVGMSIAIGLLYYACIAISVAFGKAGILPPIVAAWLGNIVFAGIGIHLINKRS